jgi:hypothetical protein
MIKSYNKAKQVNTLVFNHKNKLGGGVSFSLAGAEK